MKSIETFFRSFGLSEKEIAVYMACVQLGEASVLTLSKRAGTKRPSTYLILESLMKQGLVDTLKTKQGITYHPLHPKKLLTQLHTLEKDYEAVLPDLIGMYHSREDKPIISIFEDYDVYSRIADEVREFVKTGKEALYFGNSEHFYTKTEKVDAWFAVMKNKKTRCREIICGIGAVQRETAQRIKKLGNPLYQVKLLAEPTHSVVTEFGVWGDTVVFFSGEGKDLFTIRIESKKMADTQRALFDQLWSSLGEKS